MSSCPCSCSPGCSPSWRCFAVLALLLADTRQAMGEARFFVYHALHHLDIVYAVSGEGLSAENPLFAGEPLRYPYLAHYFWAWASWLLDRNPLLLWQQTNFVWLALTGLLFHATARALGLRPWLAVLAVTLLFSGCNAIGCAVDLVRGGVFDDLGHPNYGSFLHKYLGFNIMPFALALLSGVIFTCTKILDRARGRSWLVLLAALLAGVGVLYPILFPIGLASAALIVVLPLPGTEGEPSLARRFEALGALVVPALVFGLIMTLLSGRTGGTPFSFSSLALGAQKTGHMAIALGPLLLVSLPELAQGLRRRDPITLFLMGVTLAGAGFYVLVSLPGGNQYKTVHVASMGAALLAARSLDLRFRLGTPAAAGLTLVLLAVIVVLNAMRFELYAPWPLAARFDLEAHRLALAAEEPAAPWIAAVRDSTPADTVLLAPGSPLPLGILTARSEYVGLWSQQWPRQGYTNGASRWVMDVLGAPTPRFEERMELLRRIYFRGAGADDVDEIVDSLRRLGRPVAILFPTAASPSLAELQRRSLGRAVYMGVGEGGVWLLEPEAQPPR
jgi:hypothetical protein